MNKTTIKQVRNILTNELGLTRKTIQEEMGKFIEASVEKHLNQLLNEDYFEELIAGTVKRMAVRQKNPYYNSFERIIEQEATKAVKEFVKNKIKIVGS